MERFLYLLILTLKKDVMKKVITYGAIVFIALIFVIGGLRACLPKGEGSLDVENSDSLDGIPFDKEVIKIKIDSLEKEISKIKNVSYSKKDEFKSIEWIQPKSERKTYDNTIYAYYGKDSSSVYYPRIVIRYYGEDWIFWEKAIFLVDGETFNFIPEEKPERDSNTEVWETSDSNLTDMFIEKFMSFKNSKSVKYRLEGDQHVKDYTLSKSKINAIYNMLLLNKIEREIFDLKNQLESNK